MGSSGAPVYTRTATRRVAYGISGILLVMVIGTVGFHAIEGMSYVNAIYFESMLATGQGPPLQLNTDVGKLFAPVMAFVSVGSVVTTLVFTLGPILTMIWREGLERVEGEAKKIEMDIREREGKSKEWTWTGGDIRPPSVRRWNSNPRPPPFRKPVLPRGWTPCCILPD